MNLVLPERISSLRTKATATAEQVAQIPDRARTFARVARQSGLLFQFTPSGLASAVRVLAKGGRNPSTIFAIHGANSPDRPAILWRDRRLTYRELDDRMNRAGAGLQSRGFRRNTSVVLMMRNRPEFLEVQAGAGRLGAAAVSVSWRSTAAELAYLAQHCGAKAIVFESDLWHVVEQAKKSLPGIDARNFIAVDGDIPGCSRYEQDFLAAPGATVQALEKDVQEDASVVIYTSGTTGKPKGAVRKFPKDAMHAAMQFIGETPMRVDDVHLVTCPLYHSTAFGFLAFNAILGGTAVLMDDFKPETFLQLVERHGVSTSAVVPTIMHRVMSLDPSILQKYDVRSMRGIFTVGAPLSGPLGSKVMDYFGDVLFNCYGATETGLVTMAKPDDLRASPGCIGKALPGNEVRLLDDQGNEVPQGDVGELYVRNKMLVAGYHNDAESTRQSMKEGFFSVGDLARRDRDGRFFIEGRKRDMIISGGVNVYPAEVEAVLEANPDVAEVAVVGVDDPEWGERVRAFVVKRPGALLDEGVLKVWCRDRLAGPKVPRDFVFMDALPRNPTGKVLKRELRAAASVAATTAHAE
ncbi:MAG TPA: AMP-binding protein [Polyangiaceae bacterium]|jgi:fatty-acyl-CoA synthase|nr:AMP-binding protein [Polyangiaceae bacterium]